ncbi:hypothetical protein SH528x_002972 [Novipirellula sp. SH528]|uniref:hypothetical protein n=1 Tax=Novipirellula sp. SH528 TaxID=3454466 RepID=UPI003F9F2945
MTMRTPLLYAGMLAARELTNTLQGKQLGVTLCELHDQKPEFICSEGTSMLLELFESNTNNAEHASLVHHGTVTFTDGSKCAAIMMRAATANPDWVPFVVGLPYRPPNAPNGFAIYGAVILSTAPPEAKDWLDFLFEGFETENPNLWREYSDDLGK